MRRWRCLVVGVLPWSVAGSLSGLWADPPPEPPGLPDQFIWERPALGDLFTPPTRPGQKTGERGERPPPNPAFPLQLLGVDFGDEVPRLTGYRGSGRALRGVFEVPGHGEVLAGSGERLSPDGWTVASLALRRRRPGEAAADTPRTVVAVVVAADAGRRVTLQAGPAGPLIDAESPTLAARLERTDRADILVVRTGDRLELNSQTWVVGAITLVPPSVTLQTRPDPTRTEVGATVVMDLAMPDPREP